MHLVNEQIQGQIKLVLSTKVERFFKFDIAETCFFKESLTENAKTVTEILAKYDSKEEAILGHIEFCKQYGLSWKDTKKSFLSFEDQMKQELEKVTANLINAISNDASKAL